MKKAVIILFLLFAVSSLHAKKWVVVDSMANDGWWLNTLFINVQCADENNCAVAANYNLAWPFCRVTHDGGHTWETTLCDSAYWYEVDGKTYYYKPPKVKSMSFPDTNLCIIMCDSGYYWRSTDNCRTWEKHQIQGIVTYNYMDPINIFFVDKNIGFMCAPLRRYMTTDGGLTWFDYNFIINDTLDTDTCLLLNIATGLKESAYMMLFENNQYNDFNRWIVKLNKNYYGFEFYRDLPNSYGSDLAVIDEHHMWFTGYYDKNDSTFSAIWFSSDEGETWEKQLDTTSKGNTHLTNIDFIDRDNGIAWGWPDEFWRTTDGGTTWLRDRDLINSKLTFSAWDHAFLDHSRIFTVAGQSTFIYALEGTVTAIEEQPNHPEELLLFPNPAKNVLNLKLPETLAPTELSIYNILGEKVLSAETQSPEAKLNISSLPSGVYTVRATINGTEYSEKFVKE